MGPKANKKTEEKKKEKIIEDKTFGLKNKKGAKQQKFIEQVTTQVKHGNKSAREMEKDKLERNAKKDAQKAKLDELNSLFRPVLSTNAKQAKSDAAKKEIVCEFFKQGLCSKGNKCKFSHDLSKEQHSAKKNIYVDDRVQDENMEDLDEDRLESMVEARFGASNKAKPKTDIICKYFLEALENSKYGWFWECPSGNDKCIYKHCLPPGFVLKKDKKKLDEQKKENEISLEELIEIERAALGSKLTPITLESFLQWKKKKKSDKIQKAEDEKNKKKEAYNKNIGGISGKLMFEFNPDFVGNDDADADDRRLEREPESDDEEGETGEKQEVKTINLADLANEAKEVDVSLRKKKGPNDKANDKANANDIPSTSASGGKSAEDAVDDDDIDEDALNDLVDNLGDFDMCDIDENATLEAS